MNEISASERALITTVTPKAWWWVLARGVVSAAVGVIITLSLNHTDQFTAVLFAIWAVGVGISLVGFAAAGLTETMSRLYVGVLAGVTVLAGVLSTFWQGMTDQPISTLIAVWAIVAGLVELFLGLRLSAGSDMRADHIIAGALTVLFAVAEFFGGSGTTWAAGLLGFYAALVGVQLILAGVGLRSVGRRAAADGSAEIHQSGVHRADGEESETEQRNA
ncbi:HdeD family acid-resistance protein [Pseudoclavibacter sp. CFCC 11306]|uniref:HdeD family acid-resistance protein n=1 Tax=Pseudoclavibacter sp. CFCC 11306 TaxID=1564493 RepID=UPI0013014963|nr:hypothetical protein [Pseudoclavibacter sp. CFCC 11306]KAB1659194.1 hypothetical protein F8O09_06510 [Pseudoclavibacter sp. CFCC 11306]